MNIRNYGNKHVKTKLNSHLIITGSGYPPKSESSKVIYTVILATQLRTEQGLIGSHSTHCGCMMSVCMVVECKVSLLFLCL